MKCDSVLKNQDDIQRRNSKKDGSIPRLVEKAKSEISLELGNKDPECIDRGFDMCIMESVFNGKRYRLENLAFFAKILKKRLIWMIKIFNRDIIRKGKDIIKCM